MEVETEKAGEPASEEWHAIDRMAADYAADSDKPYDYYLSDEGRYHTTDERGNMVARRRQRLHRAVRQWPGLPMDAYAAMGVATDRRALYRDAAALVQLGYCADLRYFLPDVGVVTLICRADVRLDAIKRTGTALKEL